ncbi:MAG TPA: hypothetical protein VIL00_10050 [Pseudonocardiaceae bacterium]
MDHEVAEHPRSEAGTARRALVLGGTGMLAGCVAALLAEGWEAVTPSRHRRVITSRVGDTREVPPGQGAGVRAVLRPPGHRPTGHGGVGRAAHWVRADWAEPDLLAAAVARVLAGPADLLVAWVHRPYREPVLRAVAELLAPGAPVVEVHGSGAGAPGGLPDPGVADHPTHQVVLGRGASGTRWLTHAEISSGVLAVVRAALAGEAPRPHLVGCLPPADR